MVKNDIWKKIEKIRLQRLFETALFNGILGKKEIKNSNSVL